MPAVGCGVLQEGEAGLVQMVLPLSHVPLSHVPLSHVPLSHVPLSHVFITLGHVLLGSHCVTIWNYIRNVSLYQLSKHE